MSSCFNLSFFYAYNHNTFKFNRNSNNLLGKTNTGKKTPRADRKLGYLDFTLSLTICLPTRNKRECNCSQCSTTHKKSSGFGEANLWRKMSKTYQKVGRSGFLKIVRSTIRSPSAVTASKWQFETIIFGLWLIG